MEQVNEENTEYEDEVVMDFWRICQSNIDTGYEYIKTDIIFNICSNLLYYGIAFPVLAIVTKIFYDLKIEGKENISKIKGGTISISNHVLPIDCAMVGLAFKWKKIYYTTIEDNFKIPFIRRLIKLLRAIPIPKDMNNRKYFIKAINKELKNGTMIHFYPEGYLVPYCEKIRTFKNGAFDFAVKNKVDIVPVVFTFREPKGIRKIFKKKKDVTLKILEPIRYEELFAETEKEKVSIMKEKAKNKMEQC